MVCPYVHRARCSHSVQPAAGHLKTHRTVSKRIPCCFRLRAFFGSSPSNQRSVHLITQIIVRTFSHVGLNPRPVPRWSTSSLLSNGSLVLPEPLPRTAREPASVGRNLRLGESELRPSTVLVTAIGIERLPAGENFAGWDAHPLRGHTWAWRTVKVDYGAASDVPSPWNRGLAHARF